MLQAKFKRNIENFECRRISFDYSNKDYTGTTTKETGYYQYDIPYGFDPTKPTVINFNDPAWGSNGDPYCAMMRWAKNHGITWDGLTGLNQYKC